VKASLWLGLGFSIIVLGFRSRDEVYQFAAVAGASISLLLGLLFAPPMFQVALEVASIVAVFSLCMRCIRSGC